jgi:hypothetical protein
LPREAHGLNLLKILVDSVEYKCWHEVGHATVCLHLGGDVDFIEFLDGDARGYARARCVVDTPEIERSVACGGLAAEVYLLKNGYAAQAQEDKRDINTVLLNNASMDGHAFWGREYSSEGFTEAETKEFVNYAVGLDGNGGLVPIFNQYLSGMKELVRELCKVRRVEGSRVKELLRRQVPRPLTTG